MTRSEQREPQDEPADVASSDADASPTGTHPSPGEQQEATGPSRSSDHDTTGAGRTAGPQEQTSPQEPQEPQEDAQDGTRARAWPLLGRLRRRPRRLVLRLAAVAALVGLVVAAFTVPVNKVIEAPGPAWNVLDDGSSQGTEEILAVSGTQTYPTDGALRMTTVSMTGCPGYPVTTVNVVMAWFSPTSAVLDRDEVCPESVTAEEIETKNQAQMSDSQDAAVVAALMETGLASSMTLTVGEVVQEQASSGVRKGDVLVSLTPEGGRTTQISTFTQLRETMATISPGTAVSLEVLRDGSTVTTELTTLPPEEGDKGSLLGLGLSTKVDSDVEATFTRSDVGGPSAGMMFALGIVDKVTPGSLTGGKDIAGTGTISADGEVGGIGGVRQKMAGAAESGASFFLTPADNCAEVISHEPDGLQVFAVTNLHEAVQTVEAIAAGDTSTLTTCSSVQTGQTASD